MRSMWKRLAILVLIWFGLVSLGELTFIGLFRNDGGGRHNYGVAFANEQYVRSHLGKPCSFQLGTTCSEQVLAELHHETTVDFWLDIRDRSVPVIPRLIILLCAGIAGIIVWDLWLRRLFRSQPTQTE